MPLSGMASTALLDLVESGSTFRRSTYEAARSLMLADPRVVEKAILQQLRGQRLLV